MTNIDTNVIFSPPNIIMKMFPDGAELSWDHRKCINSYRVQSCSRDVSTCYEAQEVTEKSDLTRVRSVAYIVFDWLTV